MKQKIKTTHKKMTVECLACNEDVFIGQNPKIGSYVHCNSCDAEFQIVDLEPILIDWPDLGDYIDDDEGYSDDTDDYNDIDDEYDY